MLLLVTDGKLIEFVKLSWNVLGTMISIVQSRHHGYFYKSVLRDKYPRLDKFDVGIL